AIWVSRQKQFCRWRGGYRSQGSFAVARGWFGSGRGAFCIKVGFVDRAVEFAQLAPNGFEDQRHGHVRPGVRGKESSVECDVVDVAAAEVEPRQPVVIKLRQWRVWRVLAVAMRKHLSP